MLSGLDFHYQIPSGVLVSRLGQHSFLSTTQGGKVLVDQRIIEVWQKANQQMLDRLIESLSGLGISETELRVTLACLCKAGMLERLPALSEPPKQPAAQGPLISVVIVSYNSQIWLDECLASLANQSYRPLEIILVDNHSTDDTVAWTITNHPEVHLIQLTQTVTLAQAINTGMETSNGSYFFVLNPDICLEADTVSELVKIAQAEPDCAAVAAKLRLYWTPGFLNGIGNMVGAFGFGTDIGLGHLDLGQFDGLRELPSACFAAALISSAAWQKVGPLDPEFPLYYEDSEWCYRARILGFSVLAAPKAIVYHAFGSRTPNNPQTGNSATRLQRVVYGRLRFANKLLGHTYRHKFTLGYLLEDGLRLFVNLVRLRGSHIGAIWQGWRQYYAAKDIAHKRALLDSNRVIGDKTLFEIQRRYPSPLIWHGLPILTWDTIQSVYLPLIASGKTIPLPEFPDEHNIILPASGTLQRWKQIRQREGISMLFHRLYRAIQWRLSQP